MKPRTFLNLSRPKLAFHALLMACVFALTPLFSHAETLISCTGNPGGDRTDRGFYIPSFPGNSLDGVRLEFSANDLGNYSVTLTARQSTYDGRILATSTKTFAVTGAPYPQNVPITFPFPSTRITEGSRVCFSMAVRSGPGVLFYSVPNFTGGCAEVIQTEGTTPPLSSFRRRGVNILVTGQDTLIVTPSESIQAAINAASDGDTVVVDPGTYTENLTLRDNVSVAGAGFNKTTLRGTGVGHVVTALGVTNSQFQGFKIMNSGTEAAANGVYIAGGDMLLNNNWITGNQNGIRVLSGSSAIIQNNLVEANGDEGSGALNYGIICLQATPLIANNVIFNNEGAGIYMAWARSTGAQILNNSIVDNTSYGIWCYNDANVTIKNNISSGNSTGISASHGALPQISFNNVWNNRWRDYDPQSGGVAAPGLGDISEDPLFDPASNPPYALLEGSPCIDAGDPGAIYNDRDGSRNDIGAFGGPTGLLPGVFTPVTSGFLFNNIGKIPTSEITQSGSLAGLVNVDPAVASALHIYQYKDAPFGGRLWVHGLFGMNDTLVSYYRIYAAKWNGNTPPAPGDFQPVTDPLSKIKYTVNPGGTVNATLEKVGPDANGLYLRTDRPDSGYWAHPDLKMLWNTRGVANGRYDLICKGYFMFLGTPIEISLPQNDLSRITVHVNNDRVIAEIDSVRDRLSNPFPECGVIPVLTDQEEVQFEITASHPSGFLRNYTLDAVYGRNRHAGVITSDTYAGSNDGSRPTWNGVNNLLTSSVAAHGTGALDPWTTCAYQFRLRAWARTTDGFGHIYKRTFSDHYFVHLGRIISTSCVADLDGDGDVDGGDLSILGSQFGRTDCVPTP